jgi:hypothetical protein
MHTQAHAILTALHTAQQQITFAVKHNSDDADTSNDTYAALVTLLRAVEAANYSVSYLVDDALTA